MAEVESCKERFGTKLRDLGERASVGGGRRALALTRALRSRRVVSQDGELHDNQTRIRKGMAPEVPGFDNFYDKL